MANARPGSGFRWLVKWFIRPALLGILIAAAVLFLSLWKPWAQSSSPPTAVELAASVTARESQLIAEPIALKWSADAQLISLSSTWHPGQPFQDGKGDWSLLYYSPTEAATAFISVIDGTATMVESHGVANRVNVLSNRVWPIDSPMVIDQLMAAGGGDFLRSQPDATVSLSLDLSKDAIWRVRLIDQMSRRVFAVRVSLDTGEILDLQQTG
jgi:hypothetical protein